MAGKKGPPLNVPDKLTPELQEKLCALLREGHFVVTARNLVGISKTTVLEWLRRADKGIEPYASFGTAYRKAIAEGEDRHFQNIAKVGERDWRASQFLLKQRHAARWGERELKIRAEIQHEVKDEVLDMLAKIAAKKKKSEDE